MNWQCEEIVYVKEIYAQLYLLKYVNYLRGADRIECQVGDCCLNDGLSPETFVLRDSIDDV